MLAVPKMFGCRPLTADLEACRNQRFAYIRHIFSLQLLIHTHLIFFKTRAFTEIKSKYIFVQLQCDMYWKPNNEQVSVNVISKICDGALSHFPSIDFETLIYLLNIVMTLLLSDCKCFEGFRVAFSPHVKARQRKWKHSSLQVIAALLRWGDMVIFFFLNACLTCFFYP